MVDQRDMLAREVDEELRREQLLRLWDQYGTYVIAAVAVLIIGVGGYASGPVVLAAWRRARTGLDRGAWEGGALLGGLLFVGFLFQMIGLETVSAPVSAFLTSLYVVFSAILTSWMHRSRPHLAFIIGIALATFGAGFIEGPPHLTYGLGEWLTVASAFVFALHILATDRVTKAHASLPVTLAMFAVTAGAAAVSLAVCSASADSPSAAQLLTLLRTQEFIVPLLLSTVLGTIIALTLINVFQKEMDPVRAAILYALEPIWTTLIAALLGLGLPGFWLWIGGGALLTGNIIAELGAE